MYDDERYPERGPLDEPIFAEIERGDLSATVVAVPDQVMDGWTIRVFPTLDENRIIVGLNETWVQDLLLDEFQDDGSMENVKEWLNTQIVSSVHWYFKSIGKSS